MLFFKFAILMCGMGTITGVVYSQVNKKDTDKNIIVSNNQEANIRARLEKQMNIDLLENSKIHLEQQQTTAAANLKIKENDLNTEKQALKSAYDTLNLAKSELNSQAAFLTTKYHNLQTQEQMLKTAIDTKMTYELDKNSMKLNLEFYQAQKKAYESEKNAIKSKLEKTLNKSITQDICDSGYDVSIGTTGSQTNEEIQIEAQLKKELTDVCYGLTTNATAISGNSTNLTDNSNYSDTNSTRENTIKEISNKIQEYNLQIIKIKSAEFDVQMKQLKFQQSTKEYETAAIKNEQIKNEIEILNEKIYQLTI